MNVYRPTIAEKLVCKCNGVFASMLYRSMFIFKYRSVTLSCRICPNESWDGSSTNETHLSHLKRLYKRTIRIIIKPPFNSHSQPLFQKLGLLNLSKIRNYQIV